MPVVAAVVRGGEDPAGAAVDLVDAEQAPAAGGVLEGREPAAPVVVALAGGVLRLPGGDGGDQRLAELLPVEMAGVAERHHHAEGAALPGLREHQVAVAARRGRRAAGVELPERGGGAAHDPTGTS